MKKIIRWIVSKLLPLTYERLTLDKVNSKLIVPVDWLVIDGRQYYQFVNFADMPQARMVHFKHFRQELVMGIDRDQINEYLENMKDANDKGEKSQLGALIYMLQDTINNCTPLEAMYNMAALVWFDRDEDLKCFDGDYNLEKIRAFKTFPDQTFFFERLLREGLKDAGVETPNAIEDYLRKSAIKLRAYAQILSEVSAKRA